MPRKNTQNSFPYPTTEQPKKAKVMQSEQTFKRSFAPLTSKKDGTARLTFAGYKHSITKNGRERPFFSIIFSCMDVTRESPANISVLSPYRYSESNILGKLLKALGYVGGNQTETILDENDEFGYVVRQDLSRIYDFLDTKRGLVFKGVMILGERNLYRIEVETLEPLAGKDGKQQRDYTADEGLSEKEIAIDLEADGGDNE
ncbi:MAG: hypothetical protein KME30_29985 [Iphinoe sp. HA4291-MV1]|jgi:hypothetical protein|nr:hypothetical protein [Iphinoe sp. HA4291-MV1]